MRVAVHLLHIRNHLKLIIYLYLKYIASRLLCSNWTYCTPSTFCSNRFLVSLVFSQNWPNLTVPSFSSLPPIIFHQPSFGFFPSSLFCYYLSFLYPSVPRFSPIPMVFFHRSLSAVAVAVIVATLFISPQLSPHPPCHSQMSTLPGTLLPSSLHGHNWLFHTTGSYVPIYIDSYSQPLTGFLTSVRLITFLLLYASSSTQSSYSFSICLDYASSTDNSFCFLLSRHFRFYFIASLPLTSAFLPSHTYLLCLLFILTNLASSTLPAMATIVVATVTTFRFDNRHV
jgi:hypothetical protein